MYAVIPAGNGHGASADVDISLAVIVAVLGVEPVRSGPEAERSVLDPDGIVGFKCLGACGDGIASAGDLQVILAYHAVVRGLDRQFSCPVHHQVSPAEYRAVCVDAPVRPECPVHRQGAVCRSRDEHLVRVVHVDTGEIAVGDAQVLQHQLHLVIVPRFHIDGGVGSRAGQHVGPCFRNPDFLPVFRGQGNRLVQVRRLFQVPVGKQVAAAVYRRSVLRRGRGHSSGTSGKDHCCKQEYGCNSCRHPGKCALHFHIEAPPFLSLMVPL